MSTASYEVHETLLKAEGVSLKLGGRLILRDVNLEIKNIVRPGATQGQVVGLLGPSGIGKTRLFRILSGLDVPMSGNVTVGADGVPVRRGRVGVVAQNYPLFPNRTVLGNLVVAGKQAGLSSTAAKEKAEGMLKRFGIEDSGHKYPSELSGGMRQRAAIAQQFMCSEHYLLMDEPFSGLDPVAVDRVVEFVQEIAAMDEMNTFIVVTHDITAALAVCDTIWLLGRDRDQNGKIIEGSRIQASYNLIDKGLAWQRGIVDKPEFHEMVRAIKDIFPRL